jgi:hypothetical protein
LSLASQVMLFRRSNTEKGQVEMGKNFVPKALETPICITFSRITRYALET